MSLKLQQVNDWMDLSNLRESDLSVDVHFVVGGFKIPCHRLVLAASSDLFAKILHDHPESDSIEIHIPGISHSAIKSFLDFIYTGVVVCDSETVNNMISLLNELDFRSGVTISDHGCKSDLQLSLKNIVSIADGMQEQTESEEVVLMFFQEESEESEEDRYLKSDSDICSIQIEESSEQNFQPDVAQPDIPNVFKPEVANGVKQDFVDNTSQSLLWQTKDLNTVVINANTLEQKSDITNPRASGRNRKISNLKATQGSGNTGCSESEIRDMSDSDSDYQLSEREHSSDINEEAFTNPARVNKRKVPNRKRVTKGRDQCISRPKLFSVHPKPSIKCRFCDLHFNRHSKRLEHEVEKHGVSRHFPYACDKCDEEFKNPSLLKKHSRLHIYGVMVYPCNTCSAVFESDYHLRCHAHKHRKKLCKYCKNSLKESTSEHNNTCVARKRILSTTTPPGFVNFNIRNVCHKYNNTARFQRSAEIKINMCKYCSKQLTTTSTLVEHLARIHGIPKEYVYECPKCDNRFASAIELLHHKVAHNPGMLPYKCCHCEQYFGEKVKLKLHKEQDHLGTGICCRKCKKVVPFSEYQEHTKLHINQQCDVCGRSFNVAGYLKLHQLTHLDQSKWEFKCDECKQSFKRKDVLELHVMNKHTDRQLMPHRCSHCSAGFMHKSRLVVHMKRHQK